MSKWTYEKHHCPVLNSLPVSLNCTILLPTLISQLHTIALISHAPSSQRAFAHLSPAWGMFFPTLLPYPLPQPFYLVDFHFLTVSAKHHFLREFFPNYSTPANNIIGKFPLEDLPDFYFSVWLFNKGFPIPTEEDYKRSWTLLTYDRHSIHST